MYSDWASSLDMLAAERIINFDAPAYILGLPPRYYGYPHEEGPKQLKTFDNDSFSKQGIGGIPTTPWKKWLLGSAAATLLLNILFKGKFKHPKTKV